MLGEALCQSGLTEALFDGPCYGICGVQACRIAPVGAEIELEGGLKTVGAPTDRDGDPSVRESLLTFPGTHGVASAGEGGEGAV